MARKQVVYADFSGGMNDSAASISINDREVCVSENADYSADIMAFRTRKGCNLFNETPASEQLRSAGNILTVSFEETESVINERYEFIYDGSDWKLDNGVISLSTYGVTVTGTPVSGDMIYLKKVDGEYEAFLSYAPLDVTYMYMWSSGPAYKKCAVVGSKLYEVDGEGTFTFKINLTSGAKKLYPFVFQNSLFFGDGSELYAWGVPDYVTDSTSVQEVSVSTNDVVKNTYSLVGGSEKGHFYRSKSTRTVSNLNAENYTNTTYWEDVTDVPFFSATTVKIAKATDPSVKERVRITILSAPTVAGDIEFVMGTGLNSPSTETVVVSVATTDTTIDSVVQKILAAFENDTYWDVEQDETAVIFTAKVASTFSNGYVDVKTTGVTMTYITEKNGKRNDNDLNPIKKCTMFFTHTASYRVFACGNPDDNALYYSEIGDPTYFASDLNKVYAQNGYGKPTGLFQLAEAILISYENGWYAWNGITPLEDATWKPLNLPYGCVCNDSIVITPYSFMYLGNDGIYNVSTNVLSDTGTIIYSKNIIKKITSNRIDNVIKSMKNKGRCVGIFFDNVYYLAYSTDGTVNNRVVKYEWDTESFTEVTGWQVNAFASDNKALFFSSINYIVEAAAEDSEHDYNMITGEEKAIELHIKTKAYHFGNPFVDKVVNLLGLIFKQTKNIADVSTRVKVIIGYETYEIDTINITESLVYGRTWGHLWGFREDICKMIEFTKSSNTFQIDITNNVIDNPVTLLAIGFVYEVTDYVTPNMLKDEVLLQ